MANSQNPSQALLKKDGIGIVTLWNGITFNHSLHTVPTRRMGLGLSNFGKELLITILCTLSQQEVWDWDCHTLGRNSIEPFSIHCPSKKDGIGIVTLWEGNPFKHSLHTVPTRRIGLGLSHFGKEFLLTSLCTLSQQ